MALVRNLLFTKTFVREESAAFAWVRQFLFHIRRFAGFLVGTVKEEIVAQERIEIRTATPSGRAANAKPYFRFIKAGGTTGYRGDACPHCGGELALLGIDEKAKNEKTHFGLCSHCDEPVTYSDGSLVRAKNIRTASTADDELTPTERRMAGELKLSREELLKAKRQT
jgi:hypothetical protein